MKETEIETEETNWNLYLKIISVPSLFLLCFIFGIFPYVIKRCRMNESFLSYANTFSGGLFFGIGEFHLLAEAVEKLSKYSKLPLPFFLASLGYSLILFIQKVIFGYLEPTAEELGEQFGEKDEEKEIREISEDENEKMNSKPELDYKIDENEDDQKKESQNEKENSQKMSLLNNSESIVKLTIHSTRTTIKERKEQLIIKKKRLSGFIMLLALSIHGMFECLALGIQTSFKNTLFLFIALMIHKWAEAFALGIFFVQAKLTQKNYYLLIIFFSLVGPIGVVIGILLSTTTSECVEGVLLSISTGTFLYVACSEVIVEEFSTPIKRYLKFLLYFMGGIFAAGLTLFEYLA